MAQRRFKILHSHLPDTSAADRTGTSQLEGDNSDAENESAAPVQLGMNTHSEERLVAWNSLLETRPPKNDKEAFTKWVEKVFVVSSQDNTDDQNIPDIPDTSIIASMVFSASHEDESTKNDILTEVGSESTDYHETRPEKTPR